ncbi:DUF2750 domain-containing protein [Chryseobacterium joostei]|uniref:DUF2750 domain-containing protein n=1 Tax=Chryseobacterium joostei TaxID=112234 RepID=A0A1N7KK99_9FLAO|nr:MULTISPECIES: DUF2750 domain-containing protein [Chryseobacterium]AZA77812.1 DUF2750 domain-containing protein [Chryseobacterium sp. G0186]AZB00007.1 DUF2750 domain-containing protein [Chryseobacterium joostei]SIS61987.1 Protein of unknown function [Chryseobacterium joostei]
MNQKEIENVISLEPIERYNYFIKKVADWEIFYTLLNESGEYALSELKDKKLFPMWSAREFAELCKVSGWETYTVKELKLDDLENEIIDFIADQNCLINVFPIYNRTGFVVSLIEFSKDLSEELKNYS